MWCGGGSVEWDSVNFKGGLSSTQDTALAAVKKGHVEEVVLSNKVLNLHTSFPTLNLSLNYLYSSEEF